MKVICLVLFVAVCVIAKEVQKGDLKYEIYDVNEAPQLFEQFIKDYNKQYKNEDDRKIHYDAFVESLKTINKLNAESDTATFGINDFADKTKEELASMHGVRLPQ